MPPEVERALKQRGFLYFEQRSTGKRYEITATMDERFLRTPFHVKCILPVRELPTPRLGSSWTSSELTSHSGR